MEAPPGVSIPRDHCFVLDKAIYGCKQSARAWSDELDSHLEKIGFSRTTADPCLWTRSRNGKEWYVATYVDDLTICCTDDEARDILMKELHQKFEVKDDEGAPIDYLLGIHIKQNLEAGTIQMSQELAATKLANSFLTEQERSDACRVLSPMYHSVELPKLAEREIPDTEFYYLSTIGSLLYLSACTRPDIAAATGVLSRHSLAPGKAHVSAVKRLIQYVLIQGRMALNIGATIRTVAFQLFLSKGATQSIRETTIWRYLWIVITPQTPVDEALKASSL